MPPFMHPVPRWWNGRRGGLKIRCRKAWGFKSLPGHHWFAPEPGANQCQARPRDSDLRAGAADENTDGYTGVSPWEGFSDLPVLARVHTLTLWTVLRAGGARGTPRFICPFLRCLRSAHALFASHL